MLLIPNQPAAREVHMSGLGGDPRGPIADPVITCDQLSFTAQIASPKEDVIEQLREGYMLEIVVGDQNGQSVVLAYWEGLEVGGIADRRLQRLRHCMTTPVARLTSNAS